MLITTGSLRVKECKIYYDMKRMPNLVELNLAIVTSLRLLVFTFIVLDHRLLFIVFNGDTIESQPHHAKLMCIIG